MKKSALLLLTFFLLSASPAFAQADQCKFTSISDVNPCKIASCLPGGMSENTCIMLVNLFKDQKEGPWYNQTPTQFAKKVIGGDQTAIFGERYTFAQINWIINSIATMLNPGSGMDSPTKLFDFIKTVKDMLTQVQSGQQPSLAEYFKLGPMGLFAGGVTALYTNPPASGVSEVKHLASKILDLGSGVTPALAQGYGYSGLGGNDPNGAARALWAASRNMAYLLVVIILIAAGFLIMFRVKINPQTVVSLQTMIPKLIITLTLITFSFAIAGLVIDLIYVSIMAIVGVLSLGGNGAIINNQSEAIKWLTGSNFVSYIILQSATPILFSLVALILLSFIPNIGSVIGVIIVIIVAAIWLIVSMKVFWMLLKAYVILILQIMIAPLQIMLDLVPGQSGFGPWIRNLIANASVFVVVPIMFIIQHVISWDLIANVGLGIRSLGPTQTGGLGDITLGLPFLGGNALAWWNFLTRFGIGFVIFTMTPRVADIIRDMLKIPAFKYGSAMGESLAPVTKPVSSFISSYGGGWIKKAQEPGSTPNEKKVGYVVGTALNATGEAISGFGK